MAGSEASSAAASLTAAKSSSPSLQEPSNEELLSPLGRPIRPLPKRKLQDRLSPQAAKAIKYPPDPGSTSLLFHHPYYMSSHYDQSMSSTLGDVVQPTPGVSYIPRNKPRDAYTESIFESDEEVYSPQIQVRYKAPFQQSQTSDELSNRLDADCTVSASSSVSYTGSEFKKDNKKRKIPSHVDTHHSGSHILSSMASLGISPKVGKTSDLNSDDGTNRYGSMSLSGPDKAVARARQAQMKHYRNSRSPMKLLADGNRRLPSQQSSVLDSPKGIISAAIASAEKDPIITTPGQENVSLLQQLSKKTNPVSSQFTFHCESSVVDTSFMASSKNRRGKPRPAREPTRVAPASTPIQANEVPSLVAYLDHVRSTKTDSSNDQTSTVLEKDYIRHIIDTTAGHPVNVPNSSGMGQEYINHVRTSMLQEGPNGPELNHLGEEYLSYFRRMFGAGKFLGNRLLGPMEDYVEHFRRTIISGQVQGPFDLDMVARLHNLLVVSPIPPEEMQRLFEELVEGQVKFNENGSHVQDDFVRVQKAAAKITESFINTKQSDATVPVTSEKIREARVGIEEKSTQLAKVSAKLKDKPELAEPCNSHQCQCCIEAEKGLKTAADIRRKQQAYINKQFPVPIDEQWFCHFCEYERIYGTPPTALIRQYELKDRAARRYAAERSRLLDKAKSVSKGKARAPQQASQQGVVPGQETSTQAPQQVPSLGQGTPTQAAQQPIPATIEGQRPLPIGPAQAPLSSTTGSTPQASVAKEQKSASAVNSPATDHPASKAPDVLCEPKLASSFTVK